jgi:hypothetical protein
MYIQPSTSNDDFNRMLQSTSGRWYTIDLNMEDRYFPSCRYMHTY